MSDDQFTKLLTHLEKRLLEGFAKQRSEFESQTKELRDEITQQLDEHRRDLQRQLRDFKASEDDKSMKLFQYLRSEMASVHAAIKAVDKKVDTVHSGIDVVVKDHLNDEDERSATNHQLDRHEHWIQQLAQKLGVTLDYQEQ